MARSNDAMSAVALAGVAILILVAWRAGALQRFLSLPTAQQQTTDANKTGLKHAGDFLPNTAGAPAVGGGGGVATAARGVLDNGWSPTPGALATAPTYQMLPDTSSSGEYLSGGDSPSEIARDRRALTAAATLPTAAARIAAAMPWWKRATPAGTVGIDYSGSAGELMGGGSGDVLVMN